jgi:hypothetical protein
MKERLVVGGTVGAIAKRGVVEATSAVKAGCESNVRSNSPGTPVSL